MEFDYNIDVKISPSKLRRGKKAEILVAITNQSKEIAYCEGELKEYKIKKKIKSVKNGVYSLSAVIPFFAPKGEYVVEIYAISTDMEKGPIYKVNIEIA